MVVLDNFSFDAHYIRFRVELKHFAGADVSRAIFKRQGSGGWLRTNGTGHVQCLVEFFLQLFVVSKKGKRITYHWGCNWINYVERLSKIIFILFKYPRFHQPALVAESNPVDFVFYGRLRRAGSLLCWRPLRRPLSLAFLGSWCW